MTKQPALRADARSITFECKIEGEHAVLRFERTKRGKLRVIMVEGFSDPATVLSAAKTAALVNWLAATQGVESS